MKTKNVIIGFLLIGISVLGILYFKKCHENPRNMKNSACQFSSSDSCCVDITSRLDDVYPPDGTNWCGNTRESYGKAFGKDSLNYIRRLILEGKKRNEYDQIYGYQIDIKHIHEMYNAIQAFDKQSIKKNGEILSIAGIRFYEAVSKRTINGKLHKKADLIMIPYLSSGEDIFMVDTLPEPIVSDFKMYAHFRPCPKLCSDRHQYIHQK